MLSKDKHLLHKIGSVEDDAIESLLNLLYLESYSFVYFPVNLFLALCNNPLAETKLLDALFFILRTAYSLP